MCKRLKGIWPHVYFSVTLIHNPTQYGQWKCNLLSNPLLFFALKLQAAAWAAEQQNNHKQHQQTIISQIEKFTYKPTPKHVCPSKDKQMEHHKSGAYSLN